MIIALPQGNRKFLLAYVAAVVLPWALIFNRAVADICCVLIGALWLWQSYEQKNRAWLGDPVVKTGLLTWGWLLVVVSPFAVAPWDSFTVAVPWIRYILLYAALRYWLLTDAKSLLLAGKILDFMLSLIIIDTLWQYIFGVSLSGHITGEGERLTGPMDNVKVGIFTAKILLPAIGICLFFALHEKQRVWAVFTILLMVIGQTMILLSGERTAFVSSMIGLGCAIALLAVAERRMRIAIPPLLILFSAILFFLIKTQQSLLTRVLDMINTLSAFGESAYGKLLKAASIIGQEHWFNGAGLKGFRILCNPMNDRDDFCNLHPHNTYLEWFSETGAIGLILYCAMVIILLAISLRYFFAARGIYRLPPAVAFGTVFINFFPFMITQSVFSNWPAILLWYSVSISFASMNLKEKNLNTGITCSTNP